MQVQKIVKQIRYLCLEKYNNLYLQIKKYSELSERNNRCNFDHNQSINQSFTGIKKYLWCHELHAKSPTVQDIAANQDGVDHAHKRWVERERVLGERGQS